MGVSPLKSALRFGLSLLSQEDQPVRAFLLVHVEAFAIVTAHAFACDDFRAANCSPFTLLLADRAGIAFRPPFDPKYGQCGEQSQERANRAQKSAIEVSDKDCRNEKHSDADPHSRGGLQRKHPEGLHVFVDGDISRDQEVKYSGRQQGILNLTGVFFNSAWRINSEPVR